MSSKILFQNFNKAEIFEWLQFISSTASHILDYLLFLITCEIFFDTVTWRLTVDFSEKTYAFMCLDSQILASKAYVHACVQ